MTPHPKALHELTVAACLEWRDEHRVAECEQHIARCREWRSMLGKRDTHAATFARAALTAELERTQAVLDARPSIETERAALAKAHAAWCEHIAKPMPTDVDGELRRIAERNVLDRAQVAAYHAFIAAAQRATVRVPQDPVIAYAHAARESADLVEKASELEKKYWGPGYANKALQLAEKQGRSHLTSHGDIGLALYVVTAAAREVDDLTRALFAVRWFFICRTAGIPGAKLPDLSKWERAA